LAAFAAASESLANATVIAERAGERGVLAAARYGLAAIHRDHGHLPTAERALEQCVELYQELDDPRGEALALRGLSVCRRAVGDAKTAVELSQRAHEILDRIGDTLGATYALQSLAKARIRTGELDGLAELLSGCLEVCVGHRDRFGTALVGRTLGELALAAGDLDAAREHLGAALEIWRELALPLWEARTLRDLAAATGSAEQWADAMRIFAETNAREQAELDGLTPAEWLAQVLIDDL
jgi:tetratricopeptide (TPR) repeat protein